MLIGSTRWLVIASCLVVACSSETTPARFDVSTGTQGTGGSPSSGSGGGAGGVGSGGSGGTTIGAGTGGAAGNGLISTDAGSIGTLPPPCAMLCTDFPADPIVETGVPADAGSIFGAAGTGAQGTGPCLADPQEGTLFPSNWLRPRFSFQAPTGQTLFEIRVHSDREKNDLVVYTKATTWSMPKEMWRALAAHVVDQPITVTVRGAVVAAGGAPAVHVSASSTFTIAPVDAPGSIVYWTTSGTSALKGFTAGDETVYPVLTPEMVGSTVKCIGCHTSTPDGQYIGLAANAAVYNADPASLAIRAGSNAQEPAFLSAAARQLLARPRQQIATFSQAHWKAGDRTVVSMYGNTDIIWTDLEATSMDTNVGWGVIARTGDTGTPVGATWSHDGSSIVYTSTHGTVDTGIRVLSGVGALYSVPYADRKGGAAQPLLGGGDPKFHAYYPAFSPDDRLIAFTRAPITGPTYDVPGAEIFVLPRDGAAAPDRLAANDPPRCSNRTSPGVTNSWPKWAPAVRTVGGRSFYWLTFSSKRMATGKPQIFITAIVTKDGSPIQTFPALHVWSQPELEANHTPTWDLLEIVVR